MDTLGFMLKELQKLGADDVVLQLGKEESSQVKFSNSKVDAVKNWGLSMLMIFASFKKRIVITSVKDLSTPSLQRTARELAKFSSALAPNKQYGGIAQGPFDYPTLKDYFDPDIADRTDAIDSSLTLVGDVLSRANELKIERAAGVYESGVSKVKLLTSGGVEAEEKGTRAYLSVRAFRDPKSSGHMVACTRMLDQLDVLGTVDHAAGIAAQAHAPRKPLEPGDYPVVFESLPFANLLDNFVDSASMFSVEAGMSCLQDCLGKTVASDLVNVWDDSLLPNGFSSSPFDEEGVPHRNIPVIAKGKLETYFHNTSTAKRHGTESTGSAGLISPGPTNVVLGSGKNSLHDLFEHIGEGVYVTNVWYTRFNNYATGDFSTIPRDGLFLIKDGEIVHPLESVRISDNLLKILKGVSALGKDARQVRGWEVETPAVTPPVAVDSVSFTRPIK